ELLKNAKAKLGNYYEKAFTFYPDKSTPAAARDLKDGSAIVVVNKSKNENKWFYQATVRPLGNAPIALQKVTSPQLPGDIHRLDNSEVVSPFTQLWYTSQSQIKTEPDSQTVFWKAEKDGCISEIWLTPISAKNFNYSDFSLRIET